MLDNIYAACGRLAYYLSSPLFRLLIKRTDRAYVILVHDNKVLMIKNWFGKQFWALPGGGMRRNETPQQAATRELREELGIQVDPAQLALVTKGRWQTDRLGHHYQIFSVQTPKQPDLKPRHFEILKAAWLSSNQLEQTIAPKEILDSVSKL
jgi:ADP-ribose pyrophosphatase YjhB (NUDIX family)